MSGNAPSVEVPHDIEVLARRAGLHKALAELPEDVVAAAQISAGPAAQLRRVVTQAFETWPPMRVPTDD